MNYDNGRLLEAEVADTPLQQFSRWFDQALSAQIVEPNAMVVAKTTMNFPELSHHII